ncbi:MAG: sugar-binding protein [Anaerolineaceae bacterium]|nr:sugar-binding protein [Anaerolineaceae bacterium]
MKIHYRLMMGVSILLVAAAACRLPLAETSKPVSALPNLTMTALFASGLLGSLTPPPTPMFADTVTATPLPSETPTATPTPTLQPPTATTVAAHSATPPPTLTGYPPPGTRRPGSLVTAQYLSRQPTLDGYWTDWDTPGFNAKQVVFGRQQWTGEEDLAASFRIGWDETYLYLAVKVIDDVYVQNASGQDIYKGDSIEILLDTDLYGDFYVSQLNNDDAQLGISPGRSGVDGEKEAFLWYPRHRAGSRWEVEIATVGGDGLYRVEVFIPWSVLNVTPANGKRFGFALSVSDNDSITENVQQSMVSSAGGRRLTNPTTWGELILTK